MATLDEILEHIIATDLKDKPLEDGGVVCYALKNAALVLGTNGSNFSIQVILEPPVPIDLELDEENAASCTLTPDTVDRLAEAIKKPAEPTPASSSDQH